MNRRLSSRLDLLYPNISKKVQAQQIKQKLGHDNSKPLRSFELGDAVFVENFSNPPPKWIPGKITKVTGPLSYQVELQCGTVVRRHVDNIHCRSILNSPDPDHDQSETENTADSVDPLSLPDFPDSSGGTPPQRDPTSLQDPIPECEDPPPQSWELPHPSPPPSNPNPTSTVRRSSRQKTKPNLWPLKIA